MTEEEGKAARAASLSLTLMGGFLLWLAGIALGACLGER